MTDEDSSRAAREVQYSQFTLMSLELAPSVGIRNTRP
jgi:hypothetical protein